MYLLMNRVVTAVKQNSMCETTAFFVNEATTQIELNFSSLTPGLLKRCDIQNKGT